MVVAGTKVERGRAEKWSVWGRTFRIELTGSADVECYQFTLLPYWITTASYLVENDASVWCCSSKGQKSRMGPPGLKSRCHQAAKRFEDSKGGSLSLTSPVSRGHGSPSVIAPLPSSGSGKGAQVSVSCLEFLLLLFVFWSLWLSLLPSSTSKVHVFEGPRAHLDYLGPSLCFKPSSLATFIPFSRYCNIFTGIALRAKLWNTTPVSLQWSNRLQDNPTSVLAQTSRRMRCSQWS